VRSKHPGNATECGPIPSFDSIRIWPTKSGPAHIRVTGKNIAFGKDCLFVNQRQAALTRHGINRLCKKYLHRTLSPKRLALINPAHSFRHACTVRMLAEGHPISDIKNRLGHENMQSTMVYLQLDLSQKAQLQQKYLKFTQQHLINDPKIDELIQWDKKQDILQWLDSL
jgi:integrase